MYKIAISIIKKLDQAGYVAYLAGGCVRDILLKREPIDYDIVTSAKPDEIEKTLKKTIPVGKEFGVVLALKNNHHFEIATFRSEGVYSDKRRPDKVFWASAKEDAQRRDFTINGLFLDPLKKKESLCEEKKCGKLEIDEGIIIDYVGGLKDLAQGVLRFVGNAEDRINEDHLRLLRAVRFKNVLSFEYVHGLFEAIKKNANKIKTVSGERIRDEIGKILKDKNRGETIDDLSRCGLLKIILPEVEALASLDQSKKFHYSQGGDGLLHIILALKALPEKIDSEVAWAALLHDIGKVPTAKIGYDRWKNYTLTFHNHNKVGAEMAKKILRQLKFPKDKMEYIIWLIYNHSMPPEILEMREGKKKRWLLDERLPDLLELHRADACGKGKKVNLYWHNTVKKLREEELLKPPPPPKLIDGNEIMKEFGLKPGPEIGRLLKTVEEAVWDEKIKTKKEAIKLVRKNLK